MKKINTNDPETLSVDIQAENTAKLATIFPDAVSEGRWIRPIAVLSNFPTGQAQG